MNVRFYRSVLACALICALVSIIALLRFEAAHAASTIGAPAPAFAAADTYGQKIALDQFKGKYVVLEWTNHLCPFVKKFYSAGKMQELQKTYTGKGVVWISVISSADGKEGFVDAPTANKLTSDRHASPTHIILDSTGVLGRLYDAKTTPNMVVISPEGSVIYQGAIDDKNSTDSADIGKAHNYVEAALDEAMAGKPVTTPATRSYGCSVKY